MKSSTEDTGEEDAKSLVAAACAASRRSRYVLMAMQLFSLLIATMLFNTLTLNWTDERMNTAQIAVRLLEDCPLMVPQKSKVPLTGFPIKKEATRECEEKRWIKDWRNNTEISEEYLSYGDLQKAARLVLIRGYTLNQARDYLVALEKFQFENLETFELPLVRIRVDVNGLGIFSGLGLSIMLLWFGLSVYRERRNIELLGKGGHTVALTAVRMETLFFPHERIGERRLSWLRDSFIRALPVLAMIVPLILLLFLLWNDFATRLRGGISSERLTDVTLAIELICLLFGAALASWCTNEYWVLMRQWDKLVKPKVLLVGQDATREGQ